MWWQSPGDTLIKVTCLSGLHRGCLGSRRPWVSRQQSPTLDDVTPHKHTHTDTCGLTTPPLEIVKG